MRILEISITDLQEQQQVYQVMSYFGQQGMPSKEQEHPDQNGVIQRVALPMETIQETNALSKKVLITMTSTMTLAILQ